MGDTKRHSFKPLGYYFIFLILVGTFLSWSVWSGYLFGTLSLDDNYYQDEFNYNNEGKNYSCKFWMGMVLESIDGFFVNTDITLHISDGFIEYIGENISQEENITVVLQFLPPARQNRDFFGQTEHIKTNFDGEKKYKLTTSSITINYPVSEVKRLKPVIFIDEDIIAGGLEDYEFIEIQPAYIKTQLNHTKAVTMFTIWIIIFTVMAFIFEIVKWLDSREIKNDTEGKKMIKFEDLKWKDSTYIKGFIILLVLGTILTIFKQYQISFFIVTLAFAILSIGLAFKALEIGNESTRIAKESRDIADESNEKMTSLSSANFIEIVDKYLDNFQDCIYDNGDNFEIYHNRNNIGNWATDFRKAKLFIKWASEDYQNTLTHLFVKILQHLPWDKKIITNGDVRQFLTICKDFVDFKHLEEDYQNLIKILNKQISKQNKNEQYGHYINRLIAQLTPKLDEKNINKPFSKF